MTIIQRATIARINGTWSGRISPHITVTASTAAALWEIPASVQARHIDEADETGIAPEVADREWYAYHCPEVVADMWEQTDEEACADLVRIFFGES